MGAWIERNYSWTGLASRNEYRRWLPLILSVDLLLIWLHFEFGTPSHILAAQFGWAAAFLFLIAAVYYIGWFFLTARRLRSADISRGWLLFAFLAINLPVGGYHVNVTFLAALSLTAVAATAADRHSTRST